MLSDSQITSNPRIYVTYHKPCHIVEVPDFLVPIQVGDGDTISSISVRDNTGENISCLNPSYCELTALYWIWKSAPKDLTHLGLLHYRRFFDFAQLPRELDSWGVVSESCITHDFQARYGLSSPQIIQSTDSSDVILPKPWDVRSAGFRNLRQHYVESPSHNSYDLDVCEELLLKLHPGYQDSWNQVMDSSSGYFNNMFVLRRDLFDSFCVWLFPLLSAIYPRIPVHQYDTQARRVMGYLAERLFNVWLDQAQQTYSNLSILHLDRVFLEDTEPRVWDPPIHLDGPSKHPLISVVIASDDNYVPHLGALISSIFDNLSPDYGLDLLVLDGGITSLNQQLLRRLVPFHSALSFVPMQDEFKHHFVHMHFSRSTFYRLVVDKLLTSRSKIIYIDCDTIVLGDLSELWLMDLQDHPISAVPDYIMYYFCKTNTLSADFTGSLPASDYLKRYLGIHSTGADSYFQAGLLVMDLDAMRKVDLSGAMLKDLRDRRFWFLDQDILNKYFSHSYLPLSCEWNYVNCGDSILKSLPASSREKLEKAAFNPKMIHYAGYEAKPWVNHSAWLSEYYYYYLRRTYWYETVISARSSSSIATVQRSFSVTPRFMMFAKDAWRSLPYRLRMVLNPLAYRMLRLLKHVSP